MSWVEEVEGKPEEFKKESFPIEFAGQTIIVSSRPDSRPCTKDLIWTTGLQKERSLMVSTWFSKKVSYVAHVVFRKFVPKISVGSILMRNKASSSSELAHQPHSS